MAYEERARAMGVLPICCFPCVEDDAVQTAQDAIDGMLATANQDVLTRMLTYGLSVGIIGRDQVTTDMPAHAFLRGSFLADGRDWDAGTRGLGATQSVPCTTVGEENCTMVDDARYPDESILIHEFAHAVQECGFTEEMNHRLEAAHEQALADGYDQKLYMFSNWKEFWANGTQAWFHAICRTDVNAGINTRARLETELPLLADIMREVFGEGEYAYARDCPEPSAGGWPRYLRQCRLGEERRTRPSVRGAVEEVRATEESGRQLLQELRVDDSDGDGGVGGED